MWGKTADSPKCVTVQKRTFLNETSGKMKKVKQILSAKKPKYLLVLCSEQLLKLGG